MPDEPLKHINRPDLPWRESRMTECGRVATDVAAHRDEVDGFLEGVKLTVSLNDQRRKRRRAHGSR